MAVMEPSFYTLFWLRWLELVTGSTGEQNVSTAFEMMSLNHNRIEVVRQHSNPEQNNGLFDLIMMCLICNRSHLCQERSFWEKLIQWNLKQSFPKSNSLLSHFSKLPRKILSQRTNLNVDSCDTVLSPHDKLGILDSLTSKQTPISIFCRGMILAQLITFNASFYWWYNRVG